MFTLMKPKTFYRDLFDFRHDFDEIFNHLIAVSPIKSSYETYVPPIEAWTDPEAKKFHARVALPGVDPKNVKVEVQGRRLTIGGSWKSPEVPKEAEYLRCEFAYGTFEREVPLPEGVYVEKLAAEFNHGVLEISAPMAVAALPRRIEVKPALKKAA